MKCNKHSNKKILWFCVLIFILYGIWNSRDIIFGPQVKIFSPQNGESLNQQLININGKASNIAYLSLNDREIFVDKSGYFSEKIALSPGYNILKMYSEDRFGGIKKEFLHLYFKQK